MGRGRAKAKQTKVARRLKYSGPDTDLQKLEAELKGDEGEESEDLDDEGEDLADDPYGDDQYEDDDEHVRRP